MKVLETGAHENRLPEMLAIKRRRAEKFGPSATRSFDRTSGSQRRTRSPRHLGL